MRIFLVLLFFVDLYSLTAFAVKHEAINDDIQARINNGLSFAPVFGYDSAFGVLIGGAAFRGVKQSPSSNGSLLLYGTFKGNYGAELKYKIWDSNRMFYSVEFITGNFYDLYYGEGDRTLVASEVRMNNVKVNATPSIGYRFTRELTASLNATSRYRHETGLVDNAAVKLFPTEWRTAVGATFIFDNRDNQIDSRWGYYVAVSGNYGPAFLSTDIGAKDFLQFEIDHRSFFPATRWLIFCVQLRGGISLGDPSYTFRYSLGGNDTLRGYLNNRIRGKHFYLGQFEARTSLTRWFSIVPFISAGDTAASDFSDFHGPRFTGGAGLRLGLPPDLVAKARLDFGFSSDQTGIYLTFNEAF